MDDFLNPKSMITPGMAGALVMFLSNAVCYQFPEITPRWTALLLSFVLGGLVVAAVKLKPLARFAFCVINSLIIFAVAAGSAGFAAKATNPASGGATAVLEMLISSAYAQNVTPATAPAATDHSAELASLRAQLATAQARIADQQRQLATQQRASDAVSAPTTPGPPPTPKKNAKRFFKEW